MLDKENLFSDAQDVTGNTAVNSTSYIDMGAAVDLGAGEPLKFFAHAASKSGTTPTIKALLVGADDAAFGSNKITIIDSDTFSDPVTVPQTLVAAVVPHHATKRYFRVEYTLAASGNHFAVTAGLTHDLPVGIPGL